jgi:hypothetical protein
VVAGKDRQAGAACEGLIVEIVLTKAVNGCLVPVDQQGVEAIAKMKLGQGVKVTMTRHNNVKFHRKIMALANLAYEAWDPGERIYKGEVVAKNFDQFRADLTILAGFYETRVRLNGELRFIPKSWSFAKMPDEEKDRLYSAIIDVILARILTNYTRDDLDNVVEQVLRFT